MTLGIPSLFPPRSELVNYDYLDIATGSGMSKFYGFCSAVSGAFTYHLIDSALSANIYETHVTNTAGEDTGAYTWTGTTMALTYDTSIFNIPRTINGNCFVSIPMACSINSGSGTDSTGYLSNVKLTQVHVGGGTTDLTAALTSITISEGETGPQLINPCFTFALPNISNVIIKQGEKIRLSVTYNDESGDIIAFHNPAGGSITTRGGTAVNTRLEIHIPFKVPI